MTLLLDFLPVLLFFVSYHFYGIFIATAVGMIASASQIIATAILHKKVGPTQWLTLACITILGGLTLFFRNPWFIKWKPTILYWSLTLLFLHSQIKGKKLFIERMMDNKIELPAPLWLKLNQAFCLFFIFMGILNLWVAYNFSTNVWVNYKLFGSLGLTLLFICSLAFYLQKTLPEDAVLSDDSNKEPNP
jgi:intracellular septation protein